MNLLKKLLSKIFLDKQERIEAGYEDVDVVVTGVELMPIIQKVKFKKGTPVFTYQCAEHKDKIYKKIGNYERHLKEKHKSISIHTGGGH